VRPSARVMHTFFVLACLRCIVHFIVFLRSHGSELSFTSCRAPGCEDDAFKSLAGNAVDEEVTQAPPHTAAEGVDAAAQGADDAVDAAVNAAVEPGAVGDVPEVSGEAGDMCDPLRA